MPRLARQTTYERDDDNTDDGYVSILHRSRKEIEPSGLIPTGTWTLRCVGAKAKKVHDDFVDREIDVITLTHEPLTPHSDVDPDEVAATNAAGMSTYDGTRIFTSFRIRSNRDANELARAMDAHFDEADDGEATSLEDDLKSMKGKLVVGTVYVNAWKDRQTGENKSASAVRDWARTE